MNEWTIEDYLNTWNGKGWEVTLKNFKNDRFGYFITLGVLPIGHEQPKFVEAEGADFLDTMHLAENRANKLLDWWELDLHNVQC